MSILPDREDAFEKKFAHDAELDFRVQVRASRQLGLWAAAKAGSADTEDYAAEIVALAAGPGGAAAAQKRVIADLATQGVTAHAVEREYQSLLITARDAVMKA